MKKSQQSLLALTLLFIANSTWSQDSSLTPVPEAPAIPPPVESGEPMEQDITIVKSEKGTVQQYRTNGRIYMVKVVPVVGEPYFLFDSDGDGELDSQADNIRNISVPKWVLFSW